jgi:cysteine-rich repeat protein
MSLKPVTVMIGSLVLVSAAAAAVPTAEPALVTTDRAPRLHRNVAWQRDAVLAGWTAIYDHDTGVPVRWWGPGQPAANATRDPAAAEAAARAFLAAHLDVLAPGAAASDFALVANQLDGDLRSVGFAQRAGGVPVRGGAISFGFRRDRLVMVGSTALPDVRVPAIAAKAAARVASAAVGWLAASGRAVAVQGAPVRLIVPIIHDRTGAVDITYHVADQIAVATTAGEPGRWNVFVDAATGAAFARESTLSYARGSVLFDVPDRAPMAAAGRHPQPAGDATHLVDGVPVTAELDGSVTWSGGEVAHVGPGLTGPRVRIVNQAGDLTAGNLTLPPDGTCTWSHPTDEQVDAQIAAFIYANQAKQFVRTHFGDLPFLADQLPVFVNQQGTCNAYSYDDGLHFFVATAGRCENTGRMADVVYHELGHTLHHRVIIPAVGEFNPSMSEGAADTLAVAMTGDPGVGRGFYLDNRPLRDLAPATRKQWPADATGEVHAEGEIYGQVMWDLRTALEASLGAEAGYTRFLRIYFTTLQRAVDIPSSYAEALIGDDDDGDLGNGTPDECAIKDAFAAHGLADPNVLGGIAPPTRDGYTVAIAGAPASSASCHAPSVTAATLAWRTRGGELHTMPLATTGEGALQATIPTQPERSVVEYKVEVALSNGVTQSFPLNPADPYYQFSVGAPTTIWCADFEAGADGWTHLTMPATADRWSVGPPSGEGGDPAAAHGGRNVFGLAITPGDGGRYASVMTTLARSPGIDLKGYANVHLQYYRWLGVEDGWSDQASIMANDRTIWTNYASPSDPGKLEVNHLDREWRFQDLDISDQTSSGNIQLQFNLTSDANLQASGWTLDDVCLVGWAAQCGNSLREAGEQCDDGNTRDGDGCSASCQSERGADEPAQGGGCDAGGGAGALIALAALGLRRRYRLPSLR